MIIKLGIDMSMKESVVLFNEIAGKLNKNTLLSDNNLMWVEIQNSAERVLEEAKEMVESSKNKDLTEVLDGVVDVLYTVFHSQALLEVMSIDVEGACKEICNNNLSKFPIGGELAYKSYEEYNQKGTPVEVSLSNGRYAILRTSDNKVMKPLGYISPDISEYIPKSAYEYLEEA